MKLLLITNDYPPRIGGIQVYLENIYRRLAQQHQVTVLAPAHPGDVAFDRQQPYRIVRVPGRIYWPTRSLRAVVAPLAREADVVAFGAVLPMNLIGRSLQRPVVSHTHGFEVALARTPGGRSLLRSVVGNAALVTVVSEYCGRFIARAAGDASKVKMLKTGVDLEMFHPDVDGAHVRKRFGLESRPVVACISRLVARKGQDQIIKAMPIVARTVPDVAALIVGGGPHKDALAALASRLGVADRIVFAGEVPWRELPTYYAAGDVFAMPCRSRYANLEVEGLGLVYLEAQACGRPAVTGDSGGAPEAVIPSQTGEVVSGTDHAALARVLTDLLSDPARAQRMGEAGRRMVEQQHDWTAVVARYESMLDGLGSPGSAAQ